MSSVSTLKSTRQLRLVQVKTPGLMTNGSGVETPRAKVATAQATLSLAVRINAEVVAGRLRTTIYQRQVVIHTGGTGLLLPADYQAGKQELLDGVQNLVVMALGASALTLDETLDEVFGKPDADPETARRGLRVMVNQLRNAFAHNPWRPRWVIWPKYRAVHSIRLGPTSLPDFDARNLDGACVKPEDVGGLECWVKVLKHCEGIVPA